MKVVFEHVLHPLSTSFACHHFDGKVFDCPYHVHPEIELLRIDSSRGRFLAGDHAGRFNPGDFFIFGAGLPHMFCNDHLVEDKTEAARSHYVQFRTDCFGPKFFQLPEMQGIATLFKGAARGLRYRFPAGKDDAPTGFDAVFTEAGALRLADLLRLLHELSQLKSSAESLASEGYVPITSTRSSERLERALSHINHSFMSTVDLSGTARAASMSPEAFSRFFHRHLGKTFQDYVTDLRIAEACRLLLDTDLTVAEVCFKSGFNNVANFNRHFLRRKTMSPRCYRALGEVPVAAGGSG